MKITKAGKNTGTDLGEFKFICKKCGCEWYADRTDNELHISPPSLPFFTYMDCPNCKNLTYDRERT